jgi:glycosyltransferase involved in cell wall biosynthesis
MTRCSSEAVAKDPGEKSRFVIFTPWPPLKSSGVNQVVNGIAEAAREFYDPLTVVTSWQQDEQWTGPWLRLPYFRHSRPLGFLARLLPNMLRLRRILRGAVAANAHFLTLECIPLVLLRLLRCAPPVILSIHGSDVTELLATTGFERRLCRWVFESVDLVVGCSNDLTERLLQACPQAKTKAIFNASPIPPRVQPERPLSPPYLLCVAAFIKKKAHEILISAFDDIAKSFPDLQLVIIGADGPTRYAVESQIQNLKLENRIHVLLNQPHDNVWWWMHHAEAFVLPSREEAFGIVLLEAAHSRVPVIATRAGGIPEFLTDKEDGLLCDPDQPHQLAQAIRETLAAKEERDYRVRNFYEKAKGFTWSRTFSEYLCAAGLRAIDLQAEGPPQSGSAVLSVADLAPADAEPSSLSAS